MSEQSNDEIQPYDYDERQDCWNKTFKRVKAEPDLAEKIKLLEKFYDEEQLALRKAKRTFSQALDSAKGMMHIIKKKKALNNENLSPNGQYSFKRESSHASFFQAVMVETSARSRLVESVRCLRMG